MKASVYREFRPPPTLHDEVLCLWHETILPAPDGSLKVLPDGVVDLVWADRRLPYVVGPMTRPAWPAFEPGTELYGLRLRPGVAHRLLGVNMHELVDRELELRDIWPGPACDPWHVVSEIPPESRLRAIAGAAVARLGSAGSADNLVETAASWLARHPFASVAELSSQSGLSRRQLQRRFSESIGYGPKLLQRILRLQLCLWLWQHSARGQTYAALAQAAGYADQPHMAREMRELAGEAPSALLADVRHCTTVSDLFNTRDC